jgi:hypothetical protein
VGDGPAGVNGAFSGSFKVASVFGARSPVSA